MLRPASLLLALAVVSTPAVAANYSATLAAPSAGRFITSDITWNCGPAACLGATNESRPVVLCQSLAKRTGKVENFVVDGRAFTAAELERCNASAKPHANQSLAQQ